MKPVLGTPTGSGVLPTGGIATATPMPKTFGYFGLRWCLSMSDEAARIGQALEAEDRRHAAEGGQHHREGEGQLVRGLDRAGLVDLLDEHLAGLDLRRPWRW